MVDGRVLVPAGAVFRGGVVEREPATRTNRTARLTVRFDQMTVATAATTRSAHGDAGHRG